MSGVPAVYYHGTGSENASRAYTETPMQHVQRTALRKKCMRSTFTLDCGKKKEKDKKEHAFFPFSLSLSLLPARLRDSLLRSSLFHVSPFNFNSFSSTLSLSLCLSLSFSIFSSLLFISRSRKTSIIIVTVYRRPWNENVSLMVSPFVPKGTPPFRSATFHQGMERFCSASLIAIHAFPPRSVPRARNNTATIQRDPGSRTSVKPCSIDDAHREILRETFR